MRGVTGWSGAHIIWPEAYNGHAPGADAGTDWRRAFRGKASSRPTVGCNLTTPYFQIPPKYSSIPPAPGLTRFFPEQNLLQIWTLFIRFRLSVRRDFFVKSSQHLHFQEQTHWTFHFPNSFLTIKLSWAKLSKESRKSPMIWEGLLRLILMKHVDESTTGQIVRQNHLEDFSEWDGEGG